VNGEITIKERNKGKLLFRVDSLRALENAICRALMVKYTGSIEQLHEFANIFTLKGQIELALYEHEKIIERFPHDLSITPGCYIGKAMLYMRAGLYDQAFAACDELAAAYAGDNNFHAEMPMSFWSTIAAHGARGEIHEYRKDWELAVQEYKKQLAFVRGSLRTETGDWAKAEKIVQLDEIISERIKSLEKKTEKPK
jgi:tetratricopeptide (TPR) repeat protein